MGQCAVTGGLMQCSFGMTPSTLNALPTPRIAPGEPADLTLVDLDREWVVGDGGYESRSANCCFDGRTLEGKVLLTVAAGAVAFRARQFEVLS